MCQGGEGLQLILSLHINKYFYSCLNWEGSHFIHSMLPFSFPHTETKRLFYCKGSVMFSRSCYALVTLEQSELYESKDSSIRNDCCRLIGFVGTGCRVSSLTSQSDTQGQICLGYWMTRRLWQHSFYYKSQTQINL